MNLRTMLIVAALSLVGCIAFGNDNPERADRKVIERHGNESSEAIEYMKAEALVYARAHPDRNQIQIRKSAESDRFEVFNFKSKQWVAVHGFSVSGYRDFNSTQFFGLASILSDCDLVPTEVNFESSTVAATVRFNKESVGEIGSDGRFHFKSRGVCRNQTVSLLVGKLDCSEFSDSFEATDNPHKYNGRAQLECPAKKQSIRNGRRLRK